MTQKAQDYSKRKVRNDIELAEKDLLEVEVALLCTRGQIKTLLTSERALLKEKEDLEYSLRNFKETLAELEKTQ